ncbi:MAG: DNA topoisomerase 3 [Lentisphaeraceae bacterium]|nr:DNA topoisomerase 3 [Lentisphaeraceae bacterium]
MITVIAEKPSVAKEISAVLGAHKKENGYYSGNGYAVTWAYGHLVALQEPAGYCPEWKKWTLDSLPMIPERFLCKVNGDAGVRKQFEVIKKLFTSSSEVVNCCDAAREGELIFRYIYEQTGASVNVIKRLWISSLTRQAIEDGFKNLRPIEEFDALSDAAKCRSESDWLIGMNATRAYTTQLGQGSVLSIGRVQTPVLAMIVDRKRAIDNFVSSKYWELYSEYKEVSFKLVGDSFLDKSEAEKVAQTMVGKPFTVVDVAQKERQENPPQLFDLTTLQRQANSDLKLSAAKTLEIAQKLYEMKLISYPRTDSRYLSDDIHGTCPQILQALSSSHEKFTSTLDFANLKKTSLVFNDAKISDHHAIIPTGERGGIETLNAEMSKVLEMITLRFIASFYPPCVKSQTVVTGMCAEKYFRASGIVVLNPGWRLVENRVGKDKLLPSFEKGESGEQKPELKGCDTKPPAQFTEGSLLGAMETCGKEVDTKELREALKEKGLGTPATRASIIEVLVKRGYIEKKKNNVLAKEMGVSLIDAIQDKTLCSAEMTGEWEKDLNLVAKGEKSRSEFMSSVKSFTGDIVVNIKSINGDNIKKYKSKFGAELLVGTCPVCGEEVHTKNKLYACSSEACSFVVWKVIAGKTLTPTSVKELLTKKKTKVLEGFKSKTGKNFSASLEFDEKSEVKFVFTPRKKGTTKNRKRSATK